MKSKIITLSIFSILLFTGYNANSQTVDNFGILNVRPVKYLSSDFDVEIEKLISQMTLEEKIGMLHGNSMFANGGVPRLGIPELKMADGPLGVREEISRDSWKPAGLDNDFATYYPASGALAATWNTQMAHLFGNSVGQELRARDKDMLLSPAINIVRTPLGGRTYEYMTEDPFLNKEMAVDLSHLQECYPDLWIILQEFWM